MALAHVQSEAVQSEARSEPRPQERSSGLVHVPMLRWPVQRAEAESLEASGLPFLLLVGEHEAPPLSGYRFMDWVRSPVDPDELIARHASLEARFIQSREGPRPYFDDESGRLTFARSSVDVSPSQVPLLREFVDAFREVVPEARVREVLGVSEGDNHEPLAGRLIRLRRRVRLVGLQITRVRNVGYSLEPSPST